MKMRIERVEAFGVTMPLLRTFKNAQGPKTVQKSAIVRITASDGTMGIGNIDPVPGGFATETIESALNVLKGRLAPAIIGVDPTNINQLLATLDSVATTHSLAKVAIEMACTDLTARSFGVPVHTYLGGAVKDRVEFNAWIGIASPEETAAEALHWFKQGFKSAKVKVGAGVEADRDRIAAIRGAVGNKMALRIDANESYDAETSIKLAKLLAPFELQLFEQPAPRHDLAGLARVRREGGIPVMADESIIDHASLIAVIKAEAADIVKLKLMKQGGFHRTMHMLATAEAAGIRCVVGHGFGLGVSTIAEIMLAATSHNVMAGLECVGPLKMKDDIVTQRPDISSGTLPLPPGPGLGVSLDDAKIEKYRFDVAINR